MNPIQKRYVGLDVHKHYVMVGIVDREQQTLLSPRKVSLTELEDWAKQHLQPSDAVMLEATTNAWYIYDLLQPLVARVVVAHPPHIKLIASAMVKTDRKDTMTLAKLLAAGLTPEVWVPPTHVRDLRALLAHRRRLVSQQTSAKNRLQSVLHRHHIVPPPGKLYHPDNHAWWLALDLAPGDKLRVKQELLMLQHLDGLIDETTQALRRLSLSDPWTHDLPYLIQLPGIGLITGLVILSAIGDISRFPSPKKLVGYAGLGAKVHASGQAYRTGSITKQGRKELRHTMVEAAWVAVRFDKHWQAQFDRLAIRIGRKKAIVAIARKLLVVVWHTLANKRVDRHAKPLQVAKYFLAWARQAQPFKHLGLNASAFVRQQLDLLGIGQDITRITYGSNYILPPSSLPSQEDAP
jgi:transposase